MKPDAESRVNAFVGLFFDGKEHERLIRGITSLTDEEVVEIIDFIDQYEAAHRKFLEIESEFVSGPQISENALAEFFGDHEDFACVSKDEQEQAFDTSLDSLLEQLVDNSEIPSAVQILAASNKLSVTESILKMDGLFRKPKRERLACEVPRKAAIPAEVREAKTREIFEHYDVLKKNLIDSMENFPHIWGPGQEAIAHLEPIYELGLLFSSWDRESGLSILSQKLRQCSAYKALHRYAHPLLAMSTLSALLEQDTLDTEMVEQTLWILVHGKGRPGALTISDRLYKPRQPLYSKLAVYLEGKVADKDSSLTSTERGRLYCAIELLVSAIPPNRGNKQLNMQDLAWRAVLLAKAGENRRAGELANEAINLASDLEAPKSNPFLWWSRLGDAYFNAAFSSSDPINSGWSRGIDCYNKALCFAHDARKTMVYLRQASAIAEQVELYESKMSQDEIRSFLKLANTGVELANKSLEHCTRSETAVFARARIEAVWARVARTVVLGEIALLEEKFFDSIKELLSLRPTHSGALRIAFDHLTKKGDLIGALDWLDEQIASLRGDASNSLQRMADFLEFQAAAYAIDFGLENEARERLIRIVNVTQPKNSKAWDLLTQLGFGTTQEEVTQNLYTQARQRIPDSEERKELTKSALLSNQSLIDQDPGMTDVVPWTRQARLLLFLDKFPPAIEILEELRSRFPSDPYVQFHLGEAYYRQGKLSPVSPTGPVSNETFCKATNAFERAWELKRRVDTAHQLSACWSRMGHLDKERDWLETAEELDPSDGWTKLSLGWSAYKTGAVNRALSFWVEAVQCLSAEGERTDRQQARAYLAARSVVRYGQTCGAEELNLEQLDANAIRLIASAASGAGWRYPAVIESLGRFLDKIPTLGLKRIPHAVRAHLLFLQLSGGDDFAHQWHNRWYENFRALNDRSLFVEYLAGGKGVFRRAASWSIEANRGRGLYEASGRLDSKIDWKRWGTFVQLASGWGNQKSYYRDIYSTFPAGDVGSEELYLVLQIINGRLFRRAMDEIGFDEAPINHLQVSAILYSFPIEPEILPATEIDPNAPELVLVHTDELASRILLDSASKLIELSSANRARKSWNLVSDRLCCSFSQGDGLSSVDFDSLMSSASRNGNQITKSPDGVVDVCIPAWA